MSVDVVIGGSEIEVSNGSAGPKGSPGPPGPQGPVGDPGPKGDKGDPGPPGPIGPRGFQGTQGVQGAKGDQGVGGSTGPQGPFGAQGPRGEQGIQGGVGPAGPTGPQGPLGATGQKGALGPTGPQGAQGLTGATGPVGMTGSTGLKGDRGDVGARGSVGSMGPSGPKGDQGLAGPKGDTGPIGAPGFPGLTGPKGDKGDDGTGLSIKGTDTWAHIAALPTPQTGDTWVLSTDDATAPDPPGGTNGGTTGDGIFYDAGWSNIGPLRGPVGPLGPAGSTGAPGTQGVKGDKGDKGDQGNTGTTGAAGTPGVTGLKGDKGDKGDRGEKGLTGATGQQGTSGPKGDTGAVGPSGIQGQTGPQGTQGIQGVVGATGIQGVKGDKGDTGAKGDTGTTGTPGTPGTAGATGQVGPMGPGVTIRGTATWSVIRLIAAPAAGDLWILSTNDATAPSPPGSSAGGTAGDGMAWTGALPWVNAGPIRGPVGPQGTQGPVGATGSTGPIGATGAQGIKGDTGAQGGLGATGAQGTQGATGPVGPGIRVKGHVPNYAGLPSSNNVAGDIYFLDDTGHAWQYYGAPTNSFGDIGYWRGDQGAIGPEGPRGAAGTDGTDGQDGIAGPVGPPGPNNYSELDVRYLTSAAGGTVGMAAGGKGQITARSDGESFRVLRNSATDGGQPFISWYDKTNATRFGYIQYVNGTEMRIVTEGATNPPIHLLAGGTTRLTVSGNAVTSAVPLNVTGRTTTDGVTSEGQVKIGKTAGEQLQLIDIENKRNVYIGFYNAASMAGTATRQGYFGFNVASTMYMVNEVDAGAIVLRTSTVTTGSPGTIVMQPGGTTAATFTGNDCVIPGNVSGGTVSAGSYSGGQIHAQAATYSSFIRTDTGGSSGLCARFQAANASPYIDFVEYDGSPRYGYILGGAAETRIQNEAGAVTFYSANVERVRISGGSMMVGKTASGIANTGAEFFESGVIYASTNASTNGNIQLRHSVGSHASGQNFIQFTTMASGGTVTTLSNISQDGVVGTKFSNCTATAPSDYRLKNVHGPVTDAVERLKQLSVYRLGWKDGHDVDFDGFLAHEVDAVLPYAVDGEKDAYYGPEDGDMEGRVKAQQLDKGSIVPLLTASLQEVIARLEALEAA